MNEAELNGIIRDLNEQIQMLEDLKTSVTEIQEETREMIAVAKMWLEQETDT